MAEVKLELAEKGRGAFHIFGEKEQVGEMVVGVSGTTLTVYHTEVDPKFEGQGFAKLMFDNMVAYSRSKGLIVMPLCQYVHAQFKRHPEAYKDVWKQ
jgi:predicted GNAT family acetyltransferase